MKVKYIKEDGNTIDAYVIYSSYSGSLLYIVNDHENPSSCGYCRIAKYIGDNKYSKSCTNFINIPGEKKIEDIWIKASTSRQFFNKEEATEIEYLRWHHNKYDNPYSYGSFTQETGKLIPKEYVK